jgi:vitamin B12 transporter
MFLKLCGKGFILLQIILIYSVCSMCYAAEENASENTNNDNVFTAEDISRMNVSGVAEVIETIPGVTTVGDDDVTINGSMEVLVLLDGRNIKDPISGQIKWDQVSLNNVGKIEVIKGGGAGYGDNASGGVIIITSKLADTFKGSVEVSAGNMNYKEYNGDIQTQVKGVKIGIMGGYSSDDGWRLNEHDMEKKAGINLSYALGPDVVISPSLNYYKDIKGLGGPYFAPTPYNDAIYESYSGTLLLKLKKINFKSIYTDSMDQSIDTPPALIPHNIKVTPQIFNQEIMTDFSFSKGGVMNLGAGYERANVGIETNISNVQLPDTVHNEKKEWAFITYKHETTNNPFSLYLGLRGTHYNNFDNSLNPEATLGYKGDKYGVVIGFNLTDRLPGYKDRYRSDAFVIANPDLEKEDFTNYKLTFFYSPLDKLTFNVTPYYTEVENLISMDSIMTVNGLRRTFVNIGSATEKGIDSSVSWSPDRIFNLSMSYNYESAKDDSTDLWLPMKAKHRFQTKITSSPIERLSISTTFYYSSREYVDSENFMSVDGHCEVDARVEYDINKYKLFFQIENMFNEEYILPFLVPAKTRFYYTGVKYSF